MSGLVKRKFFHRFIGSEVADASDTETYTIPNGVTILYIECIGSGGGGGGGRSGNSMPRMGGGGGGGGAFASGYFDATALSSTLTLRVHGGGPGATRVTGNNTPGNVGGGNGSDSRVSIAGAGNENTGIGYGVGCAITTGDENALLVPPASVQADGPIAILQLPVVILKPAL